MVELSSSNRVLDKLGKYPVLAALLAVNIISAYMIFLYAPPEKTMGDLYRIVYFMVPSAWAAYLSFGVTLLGSVLYLKGGHLIWDMVAEASAKVGVVFTGVAILVGSLWAGLAWGSYWNWDPRETTTLILFLTYVMYLSFRMAVPDVEKRARLSSVLGILAFIAVPLSYLSVFLWQSLHPIVVTPTETRMTPSMIATLTVSTAGITLVYFYMLRLTVEMLRFGDKLARLRYKEGRT